MTPFQSNPATPKLKERKQKKGESEKEKDKIIGRWEIR
jgi:hypothetical protein